MIPGQEHIYRGDVAKVEEQLRMMDKSIAGGFEAYLERAKQLLAQSKRGDNPFEGCQVEIPNVLDLSPETCAFIDLEIIGESELAGMCFCLVAGGLGERLGYPGLKISLPVETFTSKIYMQWYAEYILAFERIARERQPLDYLPLAIMTSSDTHDGTVALLEKNNYFGLQRDQVTLVQQQKVPCLIDSDAKLAVSADGLIESKPHGHGDVHSLLLQHGLPTTWLQQGRKWLLFFQDTNALAFRALSAMLGASKREGWAMNTMAIPRFPGEATGGLCRLKKVDGSRVTCSVEYNVLGALLGVQGGDKAGANGKSPYPGNTNALLFNLHAYSETLSACQGVMPEFVNPKYADDSRQKFKSSTRLECLMQDIAHILHGTHGVTVLPRWLCYSCVKNSTADAVGKAKCGLPPDCAYSGEVEFFKANEEMLRIALGSRALTIEGSGASSFGGLSFPVTPRVIFAPNFCPNLHRLVAKVKGDVVMSFDSVLVVSGWDSTIGPLELTGALQVEDKAAAGVFANAGWLMEPTSDGSVVENMRGYKIKKYV